MSNVGKEFVVLVADNTRSVNNPRLYLSTPYVTTVNVHIETPLANIVNVDVAVSYGNETVVEIPLDVAIIDTTKSNQTIHVVADDFIVLFSSNIQNNGGDAYMIFPIEVLGTEYVTVNLESKKDDYDSVISMVALKDNTVINVTLSFGLTLVYDGKNYGNETLLSLVLNKYEAFQIAHQGDLSGTILSSSSVVAVFSGHELGQPHISTQSSIDTLYEMLIPVQYWSTFYVIVTNPVFVSGDGEEVSIFASEENTAVTINIMGTPSQVVIDGKGQFHRFHLQCNTSGFIQSDKPVLVSQVTAADQLSTTSNGDSYMVLTTPVNSWVNEYTFSTPGRLDSDSFVHGLVLISHIVSVDNIVLDNNTLNSLYQWREIYDTDFSYTNIKLSEGVHSLTCVDGPRRCWGYVYGIHSLDGYGTSIGRSFVNYQELQVSFYCPKLSQEEQKAYDMHELFFCVVLLVKVTYVECYAILTIKLPFSSPFVINM